MQSGVYRGNTMRAMADRSRIGTASIVFLAVRSKAGHRCTVTSLLHVPGDE